VSACATDPVLAYEAADDYLRAVGLALLGWAWRRIAAAPGANEERWARPAAAARLRVLPEFDMRLIMLVRQYATVAGLASLDATA
jgi:hypothetical protein